MLCCRFHSAKGLQTLSCQPFWLIRECMPPRGPYVGRFSCLQEDGPNVVVALCSRFHSVRWQEEFGRLAAQPARTYLNHKLVAAQLPTLETHLPAVGEDMWHIVGLAVMVSWRLATTHAEPVSLANTTPESRNLT